MCLERPRHSPEEGGTSVRVVWPRADEGAQPGGEAARLRAGRRLLLDGGEMQPRLGSERQPRGSREAAERQPRGSRDWDPRPGACACSSTAARTEQRPAGREERAEARAERSVSSSSRAQQSGEAACRRAPGSVWEWSGKVSWWRAQQNGEAACSDEPLRYWSHSATTPASFSEEQRPSGDVSWTCPGRVLAKRPLLGGATSPVRRARRRRQPVGKFRHGSWKVPVRRARRRQTTSRSTCTAYKRTSGSAVVARPKSVSCSASSLKMGSPNQRGESMG